MNYSYWNRPKADFDELRRRANANLQQIRTNPVQSKPKGKS